MVCKREASCSDPFKNDRGVGIEYGVTLIETADVTYRHDGDDYHGVIPSESEVDNTKVEVALNGVIVQRTS